jgi:hypothetical protein
VRIGLVFEPSAEMLRFAVEQATLLWGGQYQPFFRPGDLERIEQVSRRLGVDVLLALDTAGAASAIRPSTTLMLVTSGEPQRIMSVSARAWTRRGANLLHIPHTRSAPGLHKAGVS